VIMSARVLVSGAACRSGEQPARENPADQERLIVDCRDSGRAQPDSHYKP
jgi:hypothetical protein